jgi:hypothetical protein
MSKFTLKSKNSNEHEAGFSDTRCTVLRLCTIKLYLVFGPLLIYLDDKLMYLGFRIWSLLVPSDTMRKTADLQIFDFVFDHRVQRNHIYKEHKVNVSSQILPCLSPSIQLSLIVNPAVTSEFLGMSS